MRRFSWWGWRHSWGVLVCIGSVLRLWQIGASPLWYDETNTAWMALLPFRQMLAATAGDVHPPLYLALMWGWVRLVGVNPWTFRLLSAAASIGVLFAARRLMEALQLSPGAILIGTAFLALAPFQIYYAQEGRMYALLELLVVIAYLAAVKWHWGLLALTNMALLWIHNYGALYALSSTLLGLVVVLVEARRFGGLWPYRGDLVNLLGLNLLAAMSYLSWLPALAGQLGAVKESWWQTPTTLGSFFAAWHMLLWQYAAPPTLDALAALVSFSLVFYAVYKAVRRQTPEALTLLALTLAVPALAISAEMVYRPVWLWRALIGVSVPLYYLIGWALDELGTWERRGALGLLAPLLAVSLLWYYPLTADTKGDRYQVAEQIAGLWQPGDVVMHVDIATYSGFYFRFPHQAQSYLWPPLPGTVGTLSISTMHALNVQIADLDQVPWRRAFLVWGAGPTVTGLEDELVQDLLRRYPHETLWLMPPSRTQDGGVWLLEHMGGAK